MAQGESREECEERQDRNVTLDVGKAAPRSTVGARRKPGTPIDDSDIEAFLKQAARIVLRLKGLQRAQESVALEEGNSDYA